MKRIGVALAATACVLSGWAGAQGDKKPAASEPKVKIRDAWIAEAPPTARATGGFFVAENSGTADTAIVEVKMESARTVELHEIVNENNMMQMRKVEKLRIPARGTLTLKPGGYHLMIFGAAKPLRAGDKVMLTVRFEDGAETRVEAEVRRRQEREM